MVPRQPVIVAMGGVASGGLRELIPTIARTAVVAGVDGIFMEVRRGRREQGVRCRVLSQEPCTFIRQYLMAHSFASQSTAQ
jgi:hypothetical protein